MSLLYQIYLMTTKNNSMQLRRFSNTMDLHNNRSNSFLQSTSEMVKLPALRAINKSVKYNDLSYATTRDMKKLHKQPEEHQNIQQISAHHTLFTIRKKYDNMNKKREELQKQVDNMEKQIEKLQTEKNRFESQKNMGASTIGDSGNGLQMVKTRLQEAEIQKKIMQNLILRHRADKIVYDLRKYNMQKDLAQLTKKINIIHKQYLKQKSQNEKTQTFKSKYLSHLQAEQQERIDHMNIVQGRLEQKTILLQNNEKRVEELHEISELALQDKDNKEKNWYKVYLCHRFVQKLLRDKMNRQMFKFNTVEIAFKNIKTQTGVNSADLLVKKYLNKEAAYGQLLSKIAQNQKSINNLKSETEQLKKERRQLQIEQQTLAANKREQKDLSKEQKQFQEMGQKSKVCQSYHQRLKIWLQRTLQKFKIWQKDQFKLNQNDIISSFKQYHQTMLNSLQMITDTDDKDKKLGQVKHENNYRINFEENPQNEAKNKHKAVNQNQQSDYVNSQRQQVIRNNDKYMKELKKKYDDIKKTQIQAQPKRRQIIIQKPKPAPVQA